MSHKTNKQTDKWQRKDRDTEVIVSQENPGENKEFEDKIGIT